MMKKILNGMEPNWQHIEKGKLPVLTLTAKIPIPILDRIIKKLAVEISGVNFFFS